MKIDNYISNQYRELNEKGLINPEFLDLYSDIENEQLRKTLASLHKQFEVLFKAMNERLPTQNHTAHFWAEPSRSLIFVVDMALSLHRSIKNSKEAFEIDKYYFNILTECQKFLQRSGGSVIPPNMEKIEIYYTIPIFTPTQSQKIKRNNIQIYHNLKLIDEGSYAQIFKYKDDFYQKEFALKRAKKDLNPKELERFKREFEQMKALSSPYILEVYAFEEAQFQYTMEYMNYSLEDYLKKFNTTITLETRRSIANQILKAFNYLHSKAIIHRDISPKNILIKEYEDILVVKVSDFGLVKIPDSNVTSINTEFKGYFNDPSLATEGFDSYNILHETYALTRLLYYVATGKTNTSAISEAKIKEFVQKGLSTDHSQRYQNVDELSEAFKKIF